jgi:PAS domain S-box-containing protein
MTPAPPPGPGADPEEEEEARLHALDSYAILDTPPEEGFDRIARLAARLLGTPLAFIVLLDRDRAWFKSSIGLEGVESIPRAGSCCDHAIRQECALSIPDTLADPRFAGTPIIAGPPALRYYLGVPIESAEGYKLGTLCVLDLKPRADPSPHDAEILTELASFVRDKLELRREVLHSEALARQAKLLARLMRSAAEAKDFAAAIGAASTAICDATGGLFCHVWRQSPEGERALFIGGAGQGVLGGEAYFEQLRALVLTPANSRVAHALAHHVQLWSDTAPRAAQPDHPAARAAHAAGVTTQLATPFTFGEGRYVFSLGFRAKPSQPLAVATLMHEVTAALRPILRRHLDEAESRLFRRLIETSDRGVIVSEPPFHPPGPHIVYVNAAFERMTGYQLAEIKDRSPRLLYGPETDPAATARIRTEINQGRSVAEEMLHYRKDGSSFWTQVRITPVPDTTGRITHFISSQIDVTEIRRARLERAAVTNDLQALVAAMPGVLMRHRLREDGKWIRIFIAPTVEALTGFTAEEAMAVGWWVANIEEDSKPGLYASLQEAHDGGHTRSDFRFRRKDDVWIWIRILLRGHVAADGQREVIGIWSDVTEEYRLSAEREELMRDLQILISTMPGVIVRSRKDGKGRWQRSFVSPSLEALTGYTVAEAMEEEWWKSNLHPDDATSMQAILYRADLTTPRAADFRFRHKDGHFIWINRHTAGYRNSAGVEEMISIWTDVSTEKRLMRDREELALDLEKVIATMPGALMRSRQLADGSWQRYFVSPGIEAMTGYAPAELLETDWARKRLHPEDVPALDASLEQAGLSQRASLDFRLRHKKGHFIWINRRTSHYRNPAGELEMVAIWNDVTAEKQLLEDREALADDLENVIEAMPGVLMRVKQGTEGVWNRRTYIAPRITALTGYSVEEALAPDWFRANLHPADHPEATRVAQRAVTGEPTSWDFRFRHKQGHWIWIRRVSRLHNDQSGADELIAIWTDVTPEKLMAEQMAHTAKLAQLGEMATGMAHELNQPLTGISIAAENVQRGLARLAEPLPRVREKLALIVDLTKRASDIIDHMRIFGRKEIEEQGPIPVQRVVAGATHLLEGRLRAGGIRLRLDIPEGLPPVLGAAVPLEQVLINLIGNALDAYAGRAEPVPAGQRDIRVTAHVEGGWVVIEVQDAAGGIPEDVLPRIFEPFFTTKPVGKGTGLGLSISYGIVKDMGGTITAENREGGCLMRILLPATG